MRPMSGRQREGSTTSTRCCRSITNCAAGPPTDRSRTRRATASRFDLCSNSRRVCSGRGGSSLFSAETLPMQYLIIGAGPAGVNAAETLRKLDEEADIRILGDEPEPPYSRMAIPYLLMGNIEEQGTHLRDRADHFAVLNIEVTQARVQRVDPAAHQVVLESGDAIAYDKLLIATGSSPARPPLPGIEGDNVSTCWTLADA